MLLKLTAGLFLFAPVIGQSLSDTADFRVQALRAFLRNRPVAKYSADFIQAADRYNLDWTLVPAISVVETSGGRHMRSKNNAFGWNEGRARFPSLPRAINHVTRQLATSKHYRNKTVREKLLTYNPVNPRYLESVLGETRKLHNIHAHYVKHCSAYSN